MTGISERQFPPALEQAMKNRARIQERSSQVRKSMHTHLEQLSKWMEAQCEAKQINEQILDTVLKEKNVEIEYLKQREEESRSALASQSTKSERITREVSVMENEVSSLMQSLKLTRQEKESLTRDHGEMNRRAETRQASLAQKTEHLKKAKERRLDIISRFETVLGLNVEAIEDRRLRLTFDQIDKRNSDEKYSVDLTVSGEDMKYQSVNCLPHVEDYERLEEALQRSEISLPEFVVQLRAAFVHHANNSFS